MWRALGCLLFLALPVRSVADEIARGETYFQRGHFAQALAEWQALASPSVALQLRMARAYRYLGRYTEARTILQDALAGAEVSEQVLLHTELSALSLAWHKPAQARLALEDAQLYEVSDAEALARRANQQATLLSADGHYEQAEALSAQLLQDLGEQPALRAAIAINRADNCQALAAEQSPAALACAPLWNAARQANQASPLSYQRVLGWVSLARQVLNQAQTGADQDVLGLAQADLAQALQEAESLDNPGLQAQVAASLGRLHAQRNEFAPALRLTRQAVFWGEQSSLTPLLYQWQWQLGRLLAREDIPAALTAYRHAVESLQPFRFQEMQRGFRRQLAPNRQPIADLYKELIDLLLRHADSRRSLSGAEGSGAEGPFPERSRREAPEDKQPLLEEARQLIERLNLIELQDYFNDPCAADSSQCDRASVLGATEAVLYPIILPDRLALLLQTRAGLQAFSVPVTEPQFRRELLGLVGQLRLIPTGRSALTGIASEGSLCQSAPRAGGPPAEIHNATQSVTTLAQQVYDRLFAPLESHLQGITHLTVIPSGLMRILPFAVLYDGERFLVQKYSFSSAPSQCLAHQGATQESATTQALLAGLSTSVQGFSPLPCVAHELTTLSKLAGQLPATPKVTSLIDQQFTEAGIARALAERDGGVVHIASHGSFKPQVEDSFILTYDGRLTLAALDAHLRNTARPPALLTLSACETALGDDYAVLGLAGVAVKAGVNSSLASLWRVDDEATTLLMQAFYQQWLLHGLSKAAALQTAQRALLESSEVYRHPYYWAGFVLIGSH